jgi:ABC-type polysaccharide/polyol phosphate export permease
VTTDAPQNPGLTYRNGDGPTPSVLERRLPPIAELTVLSLSLMLSGGVYMAAHLPRHPPLGPAVVLLAAGGALTVAAVALLSRIRPFAWPTFFLVARWAFVAYVVIAGILAYVFIYDHTRGATLAVLMLTLVVFAFDVPMIVAFTVARYQDVGVGRDAPAH